MTARTAAGLALLAAAVTAVLLAQRRAEHRPAAAALATGALGEGVRRALDRWLDGAAEGPPLRGFVLALAHADMALYLADDATYVALAVWLFLPPGRTRRTALSGVALAWLATVTTLATLYPDLRGEALQPVYRGIHLVALALIFLCGVTWMARREPPTTSHRVLLLVASVELALLFVGPWRLGVFTYWRLADMAYVLLYGAITLAQGVVVWGSR